MWGVWAPGVSVPCGGGARAPPFAGPGLIARVGPVRRRRRVLGGLVWCRLVLGGGRSPVLRGSATKGRGGGSSWWHGSSDCPWRGWAWGAPSAWT